MSVEDWREDTARRAIKEGLPASLRGHVVSDPRLYVQVSSVDQFPLDDLKIAVSRGVGLELLPTSPLFDLEALGAVLQSVQRMTVSGWQAGSFYTGWEALTTCTNLEHLSLHHDPAVPIDLAHLPSLRALGIAGAHSMSGALNPHLEILSITGQFDADLRVPAALRSLDIEGKNAVDLAVLPNPSKLKRLGVRRSPKFDIAALLAAPDLQDLRFDKVRVIENVPLLNRLSHLELLFLYGVKSMDGYEALADSTIATFWAGSNPVFSDEFRTKVKRPGWDIRAPQKSRG